MNRTETEKTVIKIILDNAHSAYNVEEVRPEFELINDIGMKSLDSLIMIDDLETAFNISFSDEETQQWKTVGNVIEAVKGKIPVAGADGFK